MMFEIAELQRRLANIVRVGVIESVDYASARARVTIGPLRTAPLPWLTTRAGDDRTWWAPSVGEQVIILAPSGELAAGWILPGAYTQGAPAPASAGTIDRTVYADGTVIEYDKAAHRLFADVKGSAEVKTTGTAKLDAGGAATIKAPTVTIDSPQTTCTGALTVQGLLTYQAGMAGSGGAGATAQINGNVQITGGDATADGISLKTHKHGGVQSGGSQTGTPV